MKPTCHTCIWCRRKGTRCFKLWNGGWECTAQWACDARARAAFGQVGDLPARVKARLKAACPV